MAEKTFRRAYAVEVDGEVIGFVRGPRRWDGYLIGEGLVAVGLGSRDEAGERVATAAAASSPP